MSRRHLYILCTLLVLVGGVVSLFKAQVLGFPMVPDARTEIWRVDVRVKFKGDGRPVKVTLQVPRSSDAYALIDQTFVSPGYGLATTPSGANRHATFTIRKESGEQSISYRAVVQRTNVSADPEPLPRPAPGKPRLSDEELSAARAVVADLWEQSADEASFVTLLLARMQAPRPQGELAALLGQDPSRRKKAELAADLVSLARVPARAVHGVPLEGLRRNVGAVHWLEVFIDGQWRPFNPSDGGQAAPANAMPWWRGKIPLVRIEGAAGAGFEIATSQAYEMALHTALLRGKEVGSGFVEFSVMGLPIQMRAVYQVLLTIPIGIMVLVVLRNVVGMSTFGTFMPVLMAMAFRETELLWGVALFTVVCGIGLMVRFYLEQLKLLLVPRLAAVVIVVIAIMAVLSVLSNKIGFDRGLSVALFPIVILAMTIERMSIVWEERGARESFRQAAGSIAVAMICYAVMNLALIQHLFFVFPELLLIVLAVTLLLGRYSGYRLVELPRFKILAGGR